MLAAGDAVRVARLMREVAAAELLPRYRRLAEDEVSQKRPGDIVTVADIASERRLAAGLAAILPGVPIVGEEAVEQDAGLLELIDRSEMAWIVDPLDGTANFAADKETFAMIVALVCRGQTIAGWILEPLKGRMAIAIKGQGVEIDGRRVTGRPMVQPQGYVGHAIRKAFQRKWPADRHAVVGPLTSLGCAGVEYLNILDGRAGFSIYRTTKPWDHAAGALMLAEAGGAARQFGGGPYVPGQARRAGVIGAAALSVLADVTATLETLRLPLLAPLLD